MHLGAGVLGNQTALPGSTCVLGSAAASAGRFTALADREAGGGVLVNEDRQHAPPVLITKQESPHGQV
jgi:hypothetical protein